MRGAEWLHAPFRQHDARGNVVKLLKGIGHLHVRRDTCADRCLEIGLDGMLDDEHNLLKAGAERIENGVVDDEAAFRVDGVHLLDAAAIAASHACGEDRQYGFLHAVLSL